MSRKRSWQEKLANDKDLPKVVQIPPGMVGRWGSRSPTDTLLVPAPREVDHLMRQVRRGRLTTLGEIRQALAKQHGATICCPLTTGIFAVIAANAAEEAAAAGQRRVTPWWRTLRADGLLNPKFPGGVATQRQLLEAEGHQITGSGDTLRVEGWEARLGALEPSRSDEQANRPFSIEQ